MNDKLLFLNPVFSPRIWIRKNFRTECQKRWSYHRSSWKLWAWIW